ncbi:caspase domain-containing protein [Mycena galopus ATCC 62051]|nr:caspase domain-containing protein [Mycena galopus ATCC 62051]
MKYFALIIGIDKAGYPICDLHGCVNDAKAFHKFVEEKLGPHTQIKVLHNADATRANILDTFQSFLIDNEGINKGDAIIFFYAGHGGDPAADTPKGKVETICPHDERLEIDGHDIHGIPDFTFYHLFNELAAAKGNNVTAIFDSCHSGGLGRFGVAVRHAPGGARVPAHLDSELLRKRADMSQKAPYGFAHKHMESHVILAACHETQLAHEGDFDGVCRGYFSESFVRQLYASPLHTTTNRDVIHLTDYWEFQHPQVEGVHKTRALFSEMYPKAYNAVPVLEGKKPGLFEVKMGSTSSVVPGTEFLITDGDSTISSLTAREVSFNSCVCVFLAADGPTELSRRWKAVVSKWNHTMLKIFLSPGFDATVTAALFPVDTSVPGLDSEGPQIYSRVEEDADIELRVQRGGQLLNFTVVTLKGIIADPSLKVPESKFSLEPAHIDRLPFIMAAVARFHYFLNNQLDMNPIEGVNLEMHTLQDPPEWRFIAGRPVRVRKPSPNIFNGDMRAEVATTDKLGYTFFNNSPFKVFPYLFYFDPMTFSIFKCYAPQSTEKEAPLAARRGGDIPKVIIGYNAGEEPFVLKGTPGEVCILKVFLSTENLQIDWIEQSPLTAARLTMSLARAPWANPTWDAFSAIVTLK